MNSSKTDQQHIIIQKLSLFYSIFIEFQVCLKFFRRLNIPLPLTYNFLSYTALITVGILLWRGLATVNYFYVANHYFFKNPILYGVLFIVMISLINLYEIKFQKLLKNRFELSKPTGCSAEVPSLIESFFQSNHENLVDYLKNNTNPQDKTLLRQFSTGTLKKGNP